MTAAAFGMTPTGDSTAARRGGGSGGEAEPLKPLLLFVIALKVGMLQLHITCN